MSEDKQDWLRLPAGSREELVSNFLPREARRRFVALVALRDAVLAAGMADEPVVAAAKLGWWRQELERLAGHAARHPVTIELQRQIATEPVLMALLPDILAGAEMLSRREQPDSTAALREFCFRRDGVILSASAPEAPASDRGLTRRVGIASGVAAVLADLAAGRNRFLMPADLGGPVWPDTQDAATDPASGASLRALAQAGLAELEAIPPDTSDISAATAIMLSLSRRELESRRRDPARAPHPLQSLWHAWRAASRHAARVRARRR